MAKNFMSILPKFDSYLPQVLDKIYLGVGAPKRIVDYFKECTEFNISSGKKTRGLVVVNTYQSYVDSNLCEDKFADKVYYIAWAVEIMQGSFLVLDDIMDQSLMRRGKPCWYIKQQNEGHGLIGVNDGLHLYTSVQQLIFNLFKDDPANSGLCFELLKLFHDVSYLTCFGQGLDVLSSKQDNKLPNFDAMTTETNKELMKYKTSYYTFYLPIAAGMILAGVKDKNVFDNAKILTAKLGEYFQAQDDFLDVYADPTVLGKTGTDIQEGKCTWLLSQSLEIASSEQKETLKNNLGINDPKCIGKVKQVYTELNLEQIYDKFEENIRDDLKSLIKKYCVKMGKRSGDVNCLLYEVFDTQVELLYKRKR